MQTRPYKDQDGLKCWLSRTDREVLLDLVRTDTPKYLTMQLGLHGLRTDEIVRVTPGQLRPVGDGSVHVLGFESAKHGEREPPVSTELARAIMQHRSSAGLRIDEPLVDAAKRTIRDWMGKLRVELAERIDDDDALELGMHDLRRTWATDCYYSLAFTGVPIAEQLTMSWGGWEQTSTGRETFRQNYLGPVPDHITVRAVEHLELP